MEAKKVASMAQGFNVDIANGGAYPYHNMHLQGAVPKESRVEFHYAVWNVGKAIYQDPPEPNDNRVTLAENFGLGLEPDWEPLDKFQVS